MSPRSIGLWLTTVAALFFSGVQLSRLWTIQPDQGSMPTFVSCCLILAFIGSAMLPNRHNNTATMRDQLAQIRAEIIRHLDAGHDMLAPNDHSRRTSLLSLGSDDDGTVYIQETPIDGAHRRYVVSPTHTLRRQLIDKCDNLPFTSADRAWCHGVLTPKRLQGVLDALTDKALYVPRVSRVRL